MIAAKAIRNKSIGSVFWTVRDKESDRVCPGLHAILCNRDMGMKSATEIVIRDHIALHTQVEKELVDRIDHGRRTTHVVLDLLRILMIF